ncbi:hypothetical protein OJF2_24380 [Aquisphaera giovannonii]|uniref:STAS domain-containing protein n=1 Tax=Aquisphaera giovannonii TaxID=406548 RepID=A0A5B9VZP9_9BACT|nr:STAS domain-containing protein [Aquisphaera giovannonii]QEH33906.1 hypothetical protein OJF2_24380 [Aquisphaera giovannonii]
MVLNVRLDGDLAVLSNFGRMMNDPRYVDAAADVRELLDRGVRNFVIELAGIRETGKSLLAILMTITRDVRKAGGEVVIAHPSREIEGHLAMMQMEDYWDVFPTVVDAAEFFGRPRLSRRKG